MVSFKALFATCMMALAVSTSLAAVAPDTPYFNERGVLQIGANEPMNVVVNAGVPHEQQISYAHASYIAVHFSDFSLDNGGVVIVRSPDSSVGYVYTGRGRNNAGDFISSLIPGETAVVEYFPTASGSQSNQAFRISGFSRGFPNAQSESICGVDDSVPAKCYTNGTTAATALPLAYERSQSVARLYMRGVGLCTGWLVGSEGHLLTNQHCVEDASIAGAIDVEFGAESASCAEECQVRLGCGGKIVATTTSFITNDEAFDYALLKLPAGTDVSQYKYLQLRASGASVGEQIYIPQHPRGWAKRIAGVVDGGAPAVVEKMGQVSSCGNNEVLYSADTQGGSSGSPVLAASDNAVVALHHCGGCANTAVDIRDVIADWAKKNISVQDAIAA